MLQYFRLKAQIQSTNTIVSFETSEGHRIDFSKKFLKKDSVSDRWYFTKPVLKPDNSVVDTVVFIQYGEVYIAECKDGGLAANSEVIYAVQDIVNYNEVKNYRGTQDAEECYRS